MRGSSCGYDASQAGEGISCCFSSTRKDYRSGAGAQLGMENASFRFVEALVTEGAACCSPRDKVQEGRSVRHLRCQRSDLRGCFYVATWVGKNSLALEVSMDVRGGCST